MGASGFRVSRPQAGTLRRACRAAHPGEPVVFGVLRPSPAPHWHCLSTSPHLERGSPVPHQWYESVQLLLEAGAWVLRLLVPSQPLFCLVFSSRDRCGGGYCRYSALLRGSLAYPSRSSRVSPTSCPIWDRESLSSRGL